MAYCAASDVGVLVGNLLTGASTFSTSTSPTLAAVNSWLSSGCAIINTKLKSRGYTVPSAGTDMYDMLAELNALFGAAKAEQTRTNLRLAPQERSRSQVFMEDFKKGLDDFLKGDLSRAGLGYQHGGYVGGISDSEKDSVTSDTDRTSSRFERNQFKNADTITGTQERDT